VQKHLFYRPSTRFSSDRQTFRTCRFDAHCCMSTAIKHPVPCRPGTLTLKAERQSARMSKIANGLTRSGTGCFIWLYYMSTVGVKGLIPWSWKNSEFDKTLYACRQFCFVYKHDHTILVHLELWLMQLQINTASCVDPHAKLCRAERYVGIRNLSVCPT